MRKASWENFTPKRGYNVSIVLGKHETASLRSRASMDHATNQIMSAVDSRERSFEREVIMPFWARVRLSTTSKITTYFKSNNATFEMTVVLYLHLASRIKHACWRGLRPPVWTELVKFCARQTFFAQDSNHTRPVIRLSLTWPSSRGIESREGRWLHGTGLNSASYNKRFSHTSLELGINLVCSRRKEEPSKLRFNGTYQNTKQPLSSMM